MQVPGVEGVHDLRTRRIGGEVLLDLHIVVPPRVTVSEAHEIGNAVSRRLRDVFPNLFDVTFHIDPQDDAGETEHSLRPGLPLRADIEGILDEPGMASRPGTIAWRWTCTTSMIMSMSRSTSTPCPRARVSTMPPRRFATPHIR